MVSCSIYVRRIVILLSRSSSYVLTYKNFFLCVSFVLNICIKALEVLNKYKNYSVRNVNNDFFIHFYVKSWKLEFCSLEKFSCTWQSREIFVFYLGLAKAFTFPSVLFRKLSKQAFWSFSHKCLLKALA